MNSHFHDRDIHGERKVSICYWSIVPQYSPGCINLAVGSWEVSGRGNDDKIFIDIPLDIVFNGGDCQRLVHGTK